MSKIVLHVNSRETTFKHQRVPAARSNDIFLWTDHQKTYEGGGGAKYQKNIFAQGKIKWKKFMQAN